jgi:hypothetical protein
MRSPYQSENGTVYLSAKDLEFEKFKNCDTPLWSYLPDNKLLSQRQYGAIGPEFIIDSNELATTLRSEGYTNELVTQVALLCQEINLSSSSLLCDARVVKAKNNLITKVGATSIAVDKLQVY